MNSNKCLEKVQKNLSFSITGKLMVFSILSKGD